MSWTMASKALGPGRAHDPIPDWDKWQCDHCGKVYRTEERPPAHRRDGGYYHLFHKPINRDHPHNEVHYCSDECALPHDAAEVRAALAPKKDGAGIVPHHTALVGKFKRGPLGIPHHFVFRGRRG